jgi:hypothetical protein
LRWNSRSWSTSWRWRAALALAQRGRFALELLGGGLERIADVVQLFLAAGELLLQLGLRRLGGVGFTKMRSVLTKPIFELLAVTGEAGQPAQHTAGQH